MKRRFVLGFAVLGLAAMGVYPRPISAACTQNGSYHEANTCVTAGFGSYDSYAISWTVAGSGSSPDSASTEVWIDGGSGPSSNTWSASKREDAACGDVRGFSNNWVIFGSTWVNVANHLSTDDFGYPCN